MSVNYGFPYYVDKYIKSKIFFHKKVSYSTYDGIVRYLYDAGEFRWNDMKLYFVDAERGASIRNDIGSFKWDDASFPKYGVNTYDEYLKVITDNEGVSLTYLIFKGIFSETGEEVKVQIDSDLKDLWVFAIESETLRRIKKLVLREEVVTKGKKQARRVR